MAASVISASIKRYQWTKFVFVLSWIAGLLAGAVLPVIGCCFDVPMSFAGGSTGTRFVSFLCANVLPLLLSALLCWFDQLRFLLLIIFARAFAFAYASVCIIHIVGSAGWLIRLIWMMGDIIALPVLLCYWLHRLRKGKQNLGEETLFSCSVLILLFSVVIRWS